MSRVCQITGKKPLKGKKVSHSHIRTNKHFRPNLVTKRIFVPELGRFVRVRVAARTLKSITKVGFLTYLHKQGLTLSDVT
ncbi:MAG: 50S ribosomal protein L28 [Acidobacteria bacterium]|nr:50S ribosomal protein L28 [Acidobacteriota bacterium]